MTTKKNQKLSDELTKLWTVADLVEIFGKSSMTIHIWRRKKLLPTIVIAGRGRDTIRFSPESVEQWAKVNDIPMKLTKKQRKNG